MLLLLLFTGYVQGMSDLLSPILVIMENEVDAFWCFAGLMERMVRQYNTVQCYLKQYGTIQYITIQYYFFIPLRIYRLVTILG